MKFDMLPPQKKQKLNKQLQAEYNRLNNELNGRIANIRPDGRVKDMCILCFAVIGLLVFILYNAHYGVFGIASFLFYGCLITLYCGGIGAGIGTIVNRVLDDKFEKEKTIICAQYDATYNEFNNRINKEYDEYYNQFKNEDTLMAKKLAESESAKEIAQGLIREITPFIAQADRSTNIERIDVTFPFSVFPDRIELKDTKGSEWKFDFDKWRLHALTDPVELAAIAQVICNNICVELNQNNTEDLPPAVSWNTYYYDDYVSCRIKYIAPNGNYKPIIAW